VIRNEFFDFKPRIITATGIMTGELSIAIGVPLDSFFSS